MFPILDNMTYSDIKLFYVRMSTSALLVVGGGGEERWGKKSFKKSPSKGVLLQKDIPAPNNTDLKHLQDKSLATLLFSILF